MLDGLARLVFPATCPGCGRPAEPLCARCRATVRVAPPLPPPAGLDALHVPFAYTGVVRELVARAKYRQRHAALAWLSAAMLDASGGLRAIDLVTWAPTTRSRRRTRGFDQSEILARAVATAGRRPVRTALRRPGGVHQTGRTRAERIDAPQFVARSGVAVAGRRVLLVDDVVTTGATMTQAAAALRRAGAIEVVGMAVARRP